MNAKSLILASASPRRRQLLEQIGVKPAQVVCADIDESPLPAEAPADCVLRLAIAKARHIGIAWPDAVVLAADTLIALDGVIMGKPINRDDAFAMWQRMSGRRHQVLTGIAVMHGGQVNRLLSVSEVEFARLDDVAMEAYWATGEPADKAGAYAIQGLAAVWVREIRGSYSGIMGLPLYETAQLLEQAGIKILL